MKAPSLTPTSATSRTWRGIVIPSAIVLAVVSAMVGAMIFLSYRYADRVLPHVSVAGIDLSGMNRIEATQTLQTAFDTMINKGLLIAHGDKHETLSLFASGTSEADLAYTLIDFDASAAADAALSIGRNESNLLSAVGALYYSTLGAKNVPAEVSLAEDRLAVAMREAFTEVEIEAQPTDFSTTFRRGTPTVSVVEGVTGVQFDMQQAMASLKNDAEDLNLRSITLLTNTEWPNISVSDAETLLDEAKTVIEAAPYTITGTNAYDDEQTWEIDAETIADWIVPGVDDNDRLAVRLQATAMVDFLESLHDAVDVAPENARFQIENGRVVEFRESSIGRSVDEDKLFHDLTNVLATEGTTIVIETHTEEPTITTNDANDLGIKEQLGQGWSSFKGSTWGRRTNIEAGVDKLNGLLIAPGETLSAVESLGPFTTAEGYVPELVIKGDEIIPELGGGACQIGTTLFRAAMNSGLDILERRNHSLAVSYYNDPTNGNPGTDATIYSPSPDLKIKNDTANYILLVTEITDESELLFTFWGTSDGREGYYTAPEILTWTGYSAPVRKETDTLPEGTVKCQNGFAGMTTSFDYHVTYADGTESVEEFFSSYRSLPQICLVGTAGSGTEDVEISQ